MAREICVLGAGVVGLSSALSILNTIPTARVTITADKFSPDTTSDLAGAIIRPAHMTQTDPVVRLKFRDWHLVTIDHLRKLLKAGRGSECGLQMLGGMDLYTQPIETLPNGGSILDYMTDYTVHKRLTPEELRDITPSTDVVDGVYSLTVLVNTTVYLAWLSKQIMATGRASMVKKRIVNLGELAGMYDVVVNCTGLGARELVGDLNVRPIRGQLVIVKAPQIKYYTYLQSAGSSWPTYILPRMNDVVVGGSYVPDEYNTDPIPELRKSILDKACQLVPNLRGAEVIGDAVGLRPGRTGGPRLETEILPVFGRSLKLVHNYGSGGFGFTLHWGCAQQTAVQVHQLLNESKL